MKNYPKVAVVILNWNGKFFLEKFLPSVYNSSYPNIEFVIGDNASTDDSLAFVRASYPKITLLENEQNYGFAGGYNHILARVEADYFILLNSDVEVTTNWIEPVIAMLEQDVNLVAAQPKILSFHNKAKFEHAGAAGGYIDRYGFPFCAGRILDKVEYDLGQYDDEKEIFWASGAALFIKSQAWKEAQGLDEDFFAHMEEIDLCWRLKRMGYRIGYCPDSTVYHVGGGTLNASNPQKTYLNFRNNLFMLQKNLPLGQAIGIIFIRFWFDLLALIKFLFDQKFKDAWAISRAHRSFFVNFFKNAKKRKTLQTVENKTGGYKKSIIIDFFVDKKHKFSDLNQKHFL
ncbi:glycosyltransferase family 2 protein [Sphingobacterium sp. SRCM116780]|uniref:glycosyltransferase family 2 protein n=1 Tax=Sphingobacterium sp. SRCM116780 TaxID=2907623 RepID=UPI001F3E620A|nr:glycosyltransferase family 2 protein [Sphingobacterium sp. SRCM116780]UIR57073.1 glycosyltransferase family 2 protein [Sphingobacterium sp. SRCM116780]